MNHYEIQSVRALKDKIHSLSDGYDFESTRHYREQDCYWMLRSFVENCVMKDHEFSNVKIIENNNNSLELNRECRQGDWKDETLHIKATYKGEDFLIKLGLPYNSKHNFFTIDNVYAKSIKSISRMKDELSELHRHLYSLSKEEQYVALSSMSEADKWLDDNF